MCQTIDEVEDTLFLVGELSGIWFVNQIMMDVRLGVHYDGGDLSFNGHF